ncbi:hypothetical protein HID58_056179 [Brassica napus]|uniref:Uncharacterized protein n=1 Tax=Brassica napus TaxID=3708 RepID=A0ABQ8AMM3_BRANA|nr:hypothetical protein HID58_056179 [Brassica napus]
MKPTPSGLSLKGNFGTSLCQEEQKLGLCVGQTNKQVVAPNIFSPHQLLASTSPLASRTGGRRRVSTRRSPPRLVTVPSLCPLTLLSPPLPPCFISFVYRRVAAGLGDSNRWLWVSTASLERWRGRGEPDLSWRRRQAGRSRVSHGVDLGQISPGGFAGVALHCCLCRSGQCSASTVSPMSPLTAALQRLEWTSLLAMAGPGLADPASPVLLSMSPSGWSAVPRTILRLRFSIGSSYFDAGSGFKIFSLVSCLLNGCFKTCKILAKLLASSWL